MTDGWYVAWLCHSFGVHVEGRRKSAGRMGNIGLVCCTRGYQKEEGDVVYFEYEYPPLPQSSPPPTNFRLLSYPPFSPTHPKMSTPNPLTFSILLILLLFTPLNAQPSPPLTLCQTSIDPTWIDVCCTELLSHGPPCSNPIPVANVTDCTVDLYPHGWACCIEGVCNVVAVLADLGRVGRLINTRAQNPVIPGEPGASCRWSFGVGEPGEGW